jgi:16S rRNA (adenine1518-N6/adenine1519-N6)-dimethyltransferase
VHKDNERNMVRPKKYLGQHFLTDPGISQRITGALKNSNQLPVLEIGPGKGILTNFLAKECDDFYAIDTDFESIVFLNEKFPELKDRIIHDDFLKWDMNSHFDGKFCLIGNLPYNISSPILFKMWDNRHVVDEAVFMLQKEVARRICSTHGNKEYGILSILLQTYYDTKYLFTVNEGSFFPPPKVKSGVIHLKLNPEKIGPKDPAFHKSLVKKAFNQRRKMMSNSLKGFSPNMPENADWLSKRPEQCSISDFIKISDEMS